PSISMVITSLPLPQKEAGRLNTLVKFQPEFTPIDGQFSAGNNRLCSAGWARRTPCGRPQPFRQS
ncbi:MAG: hypothetical protein J0L85_21160, partial [Zoogloea sp.]|nr:hypothetical protein [Zoogloea sp.]